MKKEKENKEFNESIITNHLLFNKSIKINHLLLN